MQGTLFQYPYFLLFIIVCHPDVVTAKNVSNYLFLKLPKIIFQSDICHNVVIIALTVSFITKEF